MKRDNKNNDEITQMMNLIREKVSKNFSKSGDWISLEKSIFFDFRTVQQAIMKEAIDNYYHRQRHQKKNVRAVEN